MKRGFVGNMPDSFFCGEAEKEKAKLSTETSPPAKSPPTPASMVQLIVGIISILGTLIGLIVWLSGRDTAQQLTNEEFRNGIARVNERLSDRNSEDEKRQLRYEAEQALQGKEIHAMREEIHDAMGLNDKKR